MGTLPPRRAARGCRRRTMYFRFNKLRIDEVAFHLYIRLKMAGSPSARGERESGASRGFAHGVILPNGFLHAEPAAAVDVPD